MNKGKRERKAQGKSNRPGKNERRVAKAVSLRAQREAGSNLVKVRSAWDNMIGHGKPRRDWSYSGYTSHRIARASCKREG